PAPPTLPPDPPLAVPGDTLPSRGSAPTLLGGRPRRRLVLAAAAGAVLTVGLGGAWLASGRRGGPAREGAGEQEPPAPPGKDATRPGTPLTNALGMKLVLIPAGTFDMGSPRGEVGHKADEEQHRVEITRPFYMGACEVTQEEYEKVVRKNPSYF